MGTLQGDIKKSILKPVLLVVLGIIVGAIIALIFSFIYLDNRGRIGGREEVEAEILDVFNKDLQEQYPEIFKEHLENVYALEQEGGVMKVYILVTVSEEQFQEIYGEKASSEDLKGVALFIKGDYKKEKGEWSLEGDLIIYVGMDLNFVQRGLSSAREKAKDAYIMSELSGMRASAELYASENQGYSYKGFCDSVEAQRAINSVADNGKQLMCSDANNTWVAFSSLYDKDQKCFCVDSEGTAKKLNALCPIVPVTSCP